MGAAARRTNRGGFLVGRGGAVVTRLGKLSASKMSAKNVAVSK